MQSGVILNGLLDRGRDYLGMSGADCVYAACSGVAIVAQYRSQPSACIVELQPLFLLRKSK